MDEKEEKATRIMDWHRLEGALPALNVIAVGHMFLEIERKERDVFPRFLTNLASRLI